MQEAGELSERFDYLLKPIRDLSENWQIDIAGLLNEYLVEIENTTINLGNRTLNFTQAAFIIQGSSNVYAKKVEYLIQLVDKVYESVKNRKSKAAKTKSTNDGVTMDEDVTDSVEEYIMSDVPHESDEDFVVEKSTCFFKNYIDTSQDKISLDIIPFFLNVASTSEKYGEKLYSSTGKLLGLQSDFNMFVCTDRTYCGTLILKGCDDHLLEKQTPSISGGDLTANELCRQLDANDHGEIDVEMHDHHNDNHDNDDADLVHQGNISQALDINNDDPDNQGLLPPSPLHNGAEGLDCNQESPMDISLPLQMPTIADQDIGANAQDITQDIGTNKQQTMGVNEPEPEPEEEKVDPYALFDDSIAHRPLPINPGVTYKLPKSLKSENSKDANAKKKDAAEIEPISNFIDKCFYKSPVISSKYEIFQEFEFIYCKYMKKLNENRKKNRKKSKTAARFHQDIDQVVENDDIADFDNANMSNFNNMEDGFDLGDDGDFEENIQNVEIEAIDFEAIRREHGISENNDYFRVQSNGKQNKLVEMVSAWFNEIMPQLKEEEERDKFDIFDYGTAILKTLNKFKHKEWLPFSYLVKKRQIFEVPRILLSTLLLANNSNIEIKNYYDENDSHLNQLNTIEIKLLTMERHQEKIQENFQDN